MKYLKLYENFNTNYKYAYNCTSPDNYDELETIIDHMREISFDTFIKNVSLDDVNNALMYNIHYPTKMELKKDWGNHYYKIKRKGIDAFILRNSAIEYIFKKINI
jgi:hypothetical protein